MHAWKEREDKRKERKKGRKGERKSRERKKERKKERKRQREKREEKERKGKERRKEEQKEGGEWNVVALPWYFLITTKGPELTAVRDEDKAPQLRVGSKIPHLAKEHLAIFVDELYEGVEGDGK